MNGPDDEVLEAIASDAAVASAEERAGAIARLLGGEDLVLHFTHERGHSYHVEWVSFASGKVLYASRKGKKDSNYCWMEWRLATIKLYVLDNKRCQLTLTETRAEAKARQYAEGCRTYFLTTILDENGLYRAEAREDDINGKLVAWSIHEDEHEARALRDCQVESLAPRRNLIKGEAP